MLERVFAYISAQSIFAITSNGQQDKAKGGRKTGTSKRLLLIGGGESKMNVAPVEVLFRRD